MRLRFTLCQDTNVAVPFGAAEANGGAIATAIDGSKAQGHTPIALSLQKAAADFPADAKERVIVLVSDGKETCHGDPVVAAKALAGAGVTVHAVGFVVDTAARGQLQAIARATGGLYFDAPVGPELPDTLKKAFEACKQRVVKLPPKPQPQCPQSIAAGHKEEYRAGTQLEVRECFSIGEIASWGEQYPGI